MERKVVIKFIIISVTIAIILTIGYQICKHLHAKKIINEIDSLTVYDTETYNSEEIDGKIISSIVDLEDLKDKINYFEVNNDIAKTLFPKAKYKPNFVLWKGEKLGVDKLKNGDEIKIRISCYDGFFAIVGIEGYYVFEGDIKKE
ncbi:hypothetical protein [Marinisporobacter balticus]|uniref:Uncharacterized protein n=1 Tax=Marinisporobacter balticus TaxID=2018667 RepID=A0A4R2KYF9_9FIRM|nr:hypothetical protein [Marinisporobacter balticus]TCO79094.1 hypothetical protein EV214_103146 [Marinisporobacter balticus]